MNQKQFASLGGRARAKALTPERRHEIASNAAKARWFGDHPKTGEIVAIELLQPCPMCGSANVSSEYDAYSYSHLTGCDSCGVCGPWCESKDAAIAAWNRRAA